MKRIAYYFLFLIGYSLLTSTSFAVVDAYFGVPTCDIDLYHVMDDIRWFLAGYLFYVFLDKVVAPVVDNVKLH